MPRPKVSKNKKRVVVAGSHGKTTITSMIMHILKYAALDLGISERTLYRKIKQYDIEDE
jgi:UDP-N-acetylmuramate-alanine ligase